MASEKQIAASQVNGALSKGPITPEGKKKSCQNATRHGALAKIMLLDSESQEGFLESYSEHIEAFQPRNHVELALINQMVVAQGRLFRVTAAQKRNLHDAIDNSPGIGLSSTPRNTASSAPITRLSGPSSCSVKNNKN